MVASGRASYRDLEPSPEEPTETSRDHSGHYPALVDLMRVPRGYWVAHGT